MPATFLDDDPPDTGGVTFLDEDQPKPESAPGENIVSNALEAAKETALGFIPKSVGDVAKFLTPIAQLPEEARKTTGLLSDLFKGKSLADAEKVNFPESQILTEADQTPAGSKERFKAGFGILAQLGMLAAGGHGLAKSGVPTLTERLGLSEKPHIEAAPETPLAPEPTNLPGQAEVLTPTQPTPAQLGDAVSEALVPLSPEPSGQSALSGQGLDEARISSESLPAPDTSRTSAKLTTDWRDSQIRTPEFDKSANAAADVSIQEPQSPASESVAPAPDESASVKPDVPLSQREAPYAQTSERGTGPSGWRLSETRTPEFDGKANSEYKKAQTAVTKAKAEQARIKPSASGYSESMKAEYAKQQAKIDSAQDTIQRAQAYAKLPNAQAPDQTPAGTSGEPAPETGSTVLGEGDGPLAETPKPQDEPGAVGAGVETTPAAETPPAVEPTTASGQTTVPEPQPAGESSTTGIAQRVHDTRAAAGKIGEIQPGVGVTPEEMVQRGRDLLKAGADPETIIQGVSEGKAVTGDEIATLRARHEELSRVTDTAADVAAKNPADPAAKQSYEDAFKTETDFAQRIKPAATEWHKVGQAMQGETDINTGSFTGLRRAFRERTGRDVTPKEAVTLDKTATKVQEVTGAVEAVKQAFRDVVAEKTKTTLPKSADELRSHFAERIKSLLPC